MGRVQHRRGGITFGRPEAVSKLHREVRHLDQIPAGNLQHGLGLPGYPPQAPQGVDGS
jgi:hypothetical protein